MIFGERPLAECEGALLAHSLMLAGVRHRKGEPVTATLLAAAAAQGIGHLWVARLQPGDVPEGEAATAIGRALRGEGVAVAAPAMGRVHLKAGQAGLLCYDPRIVARVNAATDGVALAMLPPATPVGAGQLLGSVKIVPYALEPGEMAAALGAAGAAAIAVRPWRQGVEALLIQTRLPETTAKLLQKAEEVTRARLVPLAIALRAGPVVAHAIAAVAEELRRARAPLVLVSGATVASDKNDVIPAAIRAAGGEVIRVGMPVDPGNMLVVGRLQDMFVLGLPGCVRSPKRNGLDLVLEHWAAGLPVSAELLAAMGVGGLMQESGHPVPWAWRG